MLSILRAPLPPQRRTAHLNPISYEDGTSIQLFHDPSSPYMMTHTIPASKPATATQPAFRSMFNPPLHLHLYQREEFHVQRGHACFYLNGTTHDRRANERIFIPIGAFHRFENASVADEDLVIDIRLDVQDWVMEERFFRNFFAYLEDCRAANTAPSIFQLLLFLYTVDGPLAIPLFGQKSTLVGRWLSWALMVVVGVGIGECLLGYRRTYPEYYAGEEGDVVGKKGK